MADKIEAFDNSDTMHICIIDKQKKLQLIDINEDLPTITVEPYYILIKDAIDLPAQQNGQEQGNCSVIQTILNDYEEIYPTIHNSSPSTCLETFQRLFPEKLKSWIYQSHIENSIYYRILRRSLNDEAITDLSSLEDEIIKEFPNPRLESLIRLHKSLKLAPLKLQGNWTNEEFIKEAERLKNSDNIKSAKEKLESISFKEDVTEYYTQLESIENEITGLSKTS